MLAPIVASTRARIEALAPVAELRSRALDTPPPRGLASVLTGAGLSVIAEVKRRSPSRGDLDRRLDPATQARRYQAGGASAVSVLTEPDHFAGSNDDLAAVRRACGLPVLRKDFTIHPAQVWEGRLIGADAVLLIVALLSDPDLGLLQETAAEAGLAAVVEVHTAEEAERAVRLGAEIVAVNNRDLNSFEVDLSTAELLAETVRPVPVTVAESGIHRADDAARMAAAGYDAVLVGESLVRSHDPAALIRRLRSAPGSVGGS